MIPAGFFDGLTLAMLLKFGLGGVALFMMFYLNVQWQRVFVKMTEKFNESLNGFGMRIQKSFDDLKDVLINPEKHRRLGSR